jgi:hypothetical protein
MAMIVPVNAQGLTVYVEAADRAPLPGQSDILEAGTEEVAERAVATATALTDAVKGLCGEVVDGFMSLGTAVRPDKATVEFGLTVSAEGNVFVVKGSGQASVVITAEWELGKQSEEPSDVT